MNYATVHSALLAKMNETEQEMAVGSRLQNLLGVTKSVVYKKLRGEIAFSITELFIISSYYGFSVDSLTEKTLPKYQVKKGLDVELMPLVNSFETLTAYLQQANNQLGIFNQLPDFNMVYIARDLPLFYYFKYAELGALKALVWVHESYKKQWRIKDVPESLLRAGANLYDLYTRINCREIWNRETLTNTLAHVKYYYAIKTITKAEASRILWQLDALITDTKQSLIEGAKSGKATIDIIESPFIMMSNGAFLRFAEARLAMMAISTIQTIVVREAQLLDSLQASFDFQLRHGKSLTSSSVSEIEAFFDGLLARIEDLKNELELTYPG